MDDTRAYEIDLNDLTLSDYALMAFGLLLLPLGRLLHNPARVASTQKTLPRPI